MGPGEILREGVSIAPSLEKAKIPWLHSVGRAKIGLHSGALLGWNYSTGAAAVNLAISLGATRIFLLGFDMTRRQDGRTHWHAYNNKPVLDYSYRRFLQGFSAIHRELIKFPTVRIFNVTDGTSVLPYFSRMSFDLFRKYIPPQARVHCEKCEERRKAALLLSQGVLV